MLFPARSNLLHGQEIAHLHSLAPPATPSRPKVPGEGRYSRSNPAKERLKPLLRKQTPGKRLVYSNSHFE